jgi:hypothetical protein
MLALCKPPVKYEYFSARDFHRLRSARFEASERDHPYWGFNEVGDDDGQDGTVRQRPRGRYDCL